jgi:hypothetical protein
VEAVNANRAGHYMIDEIGLNNPIHRGRRERRATRATLLARLQAKVEVLRELIVQGRADTPEVILQLDEQEKAVAELTAEFDRHSPVTPPPTSCLCPPPAPAPAAP